MHSNYLYSQKKLAIFSEACPGVEECLIIDESFWLFGKERFTLQYSDGTVKILQAFANETGGGLIEFS